MIPKLFLIFIMAIVLSLLLTPVAKWIAIQLGAIDAPNKRKIHSSSTPRFGGIAIFGSFLLTLALLYIVFPELYVFIISDAGTAFADIPRGLLIICSLLLILILGAWDDINTLSPGYKFAVQFIAASIAYFAGFSISFITHPVEPGLLDVQLVSYPLTVMWIVGITNAFNLIDGLDGLASGVAAIVLFTIVAISLVHQQMATAVTALILAGSVTGFLWFNFRPATIFLGDSGSLFLGFTLALLSIQSFTKISTTFAAVIPIFMFGLPILETLLSMVRRFFSWFLPGKGGHSGNFTFKTIIRSVFLPDRFHIHHQLISRGLSHKNTVLTLYVVSALFCAGALFVAVTEQPDATILILILTAIAIKAGINYLRYREINLLHNGIFLTFYNSLIINRQYLRKILDSLFILISYAGGYYLLYPVHFHVLIDVYPAKLLLIAGLVLAVQMSTFWLSGLYKKTIRRLGVTDVIRILKSVVIAAGAMTLVHYFFLSDSLHSGLLLFVLDFYLLATLVLGMRISFHILKYLFSKSRQDQRRVLIYGAGEQGIFALQQILNIHSPQYTPVGFLDEDPRMEGQLVNGYPVFGGHWKLERLIRSKNINELLITDPGLHPKIIQQLHVIALQYDLDIQLIKVQLKHLNFYSTDPDSGRRNSNYVN